MASKKAASSKVRKAAKKGAKKVAKKVAPKTSAKAARKPPAKPSPPVVKEAAKTAPVPKVRSAVVPDLSGIPAEAVAKVEKWICLACVLDVFTRLMGLAPKTAHSEIRNYTPPPAELWAEELTRPYFMKHDADAFMKQDPKGRFMKQDLKGPCPYCGSPAKWHARVTVYRIESGKATDAARRDLVKKLPTSHNEFLVVEEKATRQHAFFEWLDKIGAGLDLDDPRWLRDISIHYLGRKEPKVDWKPVFTGVHGIRRSRRMEEGWEVDNGRLFLAPMLFDELLLVQYLISRSHKAGGLTLEGRYTLPELFVRLRNSGYLRYMDVQAGNAGDALEQLVEKLSGGEASLKFHHIVDRRDFLEKLKALRLEKVPRPKKTRISI